MEEHLWNGYGSTAAVAKEPEPAKSNETRIVEALESIASDLACIRCQFESVTDGGRGFCSSDAAIRTTGR